MVKRSHRTRSWKKVQTRVPGGESRTFLKKELPGKAVCGVCGNELHGIPREKPIRFKNLSKSQRTVNRKFGGELCTKCAREKLRNEVKVIVQ